MSISVGAVDSLIVSHTEDKYDTELPNPLI